MFPPFRLLPKILHKIQRDLCKTILIAPAWPRQSWFTELPLLCCAKPLRLPLREDLLSQFKGRKLHQGLENLHLHAWLLSGIPSEREAFLTEKPSVSRDQSDNLQEQCMTPNVRHKMDEVEKSQFDTDDFEHALSSSDPPTTEMKFNTHDQPKSTYVTV
ncbi:unnamed protein product [Mytilus edulis]|uniref:Uncharacterized protein n=1 Tax=Mytilus edulis TaxID=6550 RepID=A0A8S3T3Y1_MYTED|nr:unnamed protein product [Mytilus edulis]